jgi:hypothetical protein
VDGGRIAGIQLALTVPGKREKRRDEEGRERKERRGKREGEVKEEENRRRRLDKRVTDINEKKTK